MKYALPLYVYISVLLLYVVLSQGETVKTNKSHAQGCLIELLH